MRYMLMFWVDESAEVTAEEDSGMMIAVKSWVEDMTERGVRLSGSPLGSVSEARIVRVRDGDCSSPMGRSPRLRSKSAVTTWWSARIWPRQSSWQRATRSPGPRRSK